MIHEFKQLSPEWWAAKRGIPSASQFDRICTPKQGKLAAGHVAYVCELIGDRFDLLYPRISDNLSPAMRHGLQYEAESRRWYEMEIESDVRQVGLCVSECGRWCCSPDGLIGDDCGLELKNPTPKEHVRYVLDPNELLIDYAPQVYGSLIVTGRTKWEIVSYCPGLPPVRIAAFPTAPYCSLLRTALEQFHEAYTAALAKFLPSEAKEAA
jgi:hypothetical protein